MTEEELQAEWRYRYTERLGILTDGANPTLGQRKIAADEANEALRILTNGEWVAF